MIENDIHLDTELGIKATCFAFCFTNLHSFITFKLFFIDIYRLRELAVAQYEVPLHLVDIYHPVAVNVVHPEGPGQLLLWRPVGGDVKGQHELPTPPMSSYRREKEEFGIETFLSKFSNSKFPEEYL